MAIVAIIVIIYLLSRRDNGTDTAGDVPYIIPVSYKDTIANVLIFAANVVEVANIKLIDPALICAIIANESEGDPNAKNPKNNPIYFGLMQISLKTAQGRGYKGDKSGLLDPDINIFYGTDYLAYQVNRYKSYILGTSAYQRGSVAYNSSGMLINIAYVNSVAQFYNAFREYFIQTYDGYKQSYPGIWAA